jgi:hypothetical protein
MMFPTKKADFPVVIQKSKYWFLILVSLCLYAATATTTQAEEAVENIEQPFDEVLEQVEAAGRYRFTADIEQTLIPRPVAANIGQSEERVDTRITGLVTLPDSATITLQFEGGVNAPPIILEQDEGKIYLVDHNGERQEIENPLGAVAPTVEFLGYLQAAANIQLRADSDYPDLIIYTFDIDGVEYANYVRDLGQSQLPPGQQNARLMPSPILQQMTGSGELWIDADGHPRRQILDIYIPEINERYHSQAFMVVDYVIEAALVGVPSLQPDTLVVGAANPLDEHQPIIKESSLPTSPSEIARQLFSSYNVLSTLAVVLTLYLVYLLIKGHRWVRVIIPVLMIITMVTTPVLQGVAFAQGQKKQEQAEKTLAQALGVDSAVDQSDRPPAPTNAIQQAAVEGCGSGNTVDDDDQDGTTNFVERCLGTDLYYFDTDFDGITDTLEIEGFSYSSQQWYLNPIKIDTNSDGLSDFHEMPASFGGVAPNLDQDNDGVPNIWDNDNDGDGVLDAHDLDPFSVTAYNDSFSLSTTLEQSTFDGYQYIELQVQPQNEDHLRFTMATLDWPRDEEGTVQDLDRSTDDIKLSPYLKVTTVGRPNDDLMSAYGITFSYLGNVGGGWQPISNRQYELFIPLSALSEGGQITAFQGKIAYEPETIDSIAWSDIQLVWMVSMANDEQNGDEVTTEVSLVAQYSDPFRITGLEITKSGDVDYAVFGTPDSTADNRDLFQLLFGLEASYLSAVSPNLDDVESRFSSPTTPITQTWGVPAADIAVYAPSGGEAPQHLDALATGVASGLATFLNTNSYPQDQMVTVALASQTEQGLAGLDDLDNVNGTNFVFNLANIPVVTSRSLKTYNVQHDGEYWREVTGVDLWTAVSERYGDFATILADLQLLYPDLSETELFAVIYGFTNAWAAGHTAVIQVDGVTLAGETADDAAIFNFYEHDAADNAVAYLIEASHLAIAGEGLISIQPDSYYAYLREIGFLSFGSIPLTVAKQVTLIYLGKVSIDGMGRYLVTVKIGGKVNVLSPQLNGIQYWDDWLKQSSLALSGYKTGDDLLSSRFASDKVAKLFFRNSKTIGKIFTVAGIVLSVAALGFELYTIWNTYLEYSSPYGYEQDFALAFAVVRSVVAVVLFILAFTGVGAFILFVFAIVGLVLSVIAWAFGEEFDLTNFLLEGLIKLFWNVDAYTRFLDFDFDGLESEVSEGLMQGATISFSDEFTGIIYRRRGSNFNELNRSTSYGHFSASADPGVEVSTHRSDEACEIDDYYIIRFDEPDKDGNTGEWYGPYQECENEMFASFTFENAGMNIDVNLQYKVVADTRYEECIVGVCDDETDHMVLPDELDKGDRWDPVTLTFDIFPDSVDALWNWNILNNPDVDGDDLANNISLEQIPDIDSDGLAGRDDWDSDGDGLSDGFEKNTFAEIGADAITYDTDGDGLSDGEEFRLGTTINDPDTDDDGLTDGEETFHWDGVQWTGGGWMVNINGSDYWVFANPIAADADGDGLNDGTEKNAGSSPNAANEAPLLSLKAGPYLVSPMGATGVYAADGQTITSTVTLLNLAGTAITETLSLCVPAVVTGVIIVASGDSSPAATQNTNCYEYDFSSDPLLFFEEFRLDLTAAASGTTTQGSFEASLPHVIDGVLTPIAFAIPYVQDNDSPSVEITAPFSNTILIGDNYVVGGFSEDDHSWVDHVRITVPAGTYTATDTSPWAYTWDLPDQGVVDVTAVAYDVVGNASSPFPVQVIVDSLAPVITSSLPPNITISSGESYSDTILLTGNVSDNYSGLERVQMRYNEQPWRTIWEANDAPLNAIWSGVWKLPAIIQSAQGEHTLHLRAYDTYGNIGYLEQTVFIDLLPPTNELTNRSFLQDAPPHVPVGEAVNLYGVANDAGHNPLPAGPVDLEGSLHSISDATIWFQPDTYVDDDSGVTVSWIGDFNGDRLGDLAVGLPAAADGAGKVVVVTGKVGGWAVPNIGNLEFLSGHKPSFLGTPGAGLGSTIQPAGDFDGNGFTDLLIGDLANNRVFLVYGSPRAFGIDQELSEADGIKWAEISSTESGETLTAHFASAGDVNNDALGDILVSTTTAVTGYVYLLVGDASPQENQVVNEAAAAVLETSAAGASVAGVGDINDDFIDDFAIATGGAVYLFAGGGGWDAHGLTQLTTAMAIAAFPTSDGLPTIVPAGDVDGDGVADFAFSSGSAPVVVFGDSGGVFTTQTLGGFGSALSGLLASAGDVDKDGQGDLLVGNADGDAYLILGNDLSTAAATIAGVDTAASAPYIAGADLAGDGSSDLLVVPNAAAASGMGFTALSQNRAPFISQAWLPTGSSAGAQSSAPFQPGVNNRALAGGDVTVGAVGADFASIQAAINSGADRVLIEPGVYQEAITVTSNITIVGSGPGLTYLTFPDVTTATVLVDVDGVSNSSLMNLTLLGLGTETGLSVSNGADNIKLERTIIQNMAIAVQIDGGSTDLDLKNNTIIANIDGLSATTCASVDVRNTIFAFNTGTALEYEGCASIKNHQFNLYWANGTDMIPNDPGGGEIFSDPLFVGFATNDLRTAPFSPVIDAGSPGDPVPPGAGDFIDIGHMEQSGASFVADSAYCATCNNDGLIWQVNAFNTIQSAVDAAQSDLATLRGGDGSQFAVGVGGGFFTETVVISYSLRLLGSGADQTTIVGNGGPAVILQSTVGTEVSGFTLVGAGPDPVGLHVTGGSNSVFIYRNLIKDNTTGILINGRSSGIAQFNTIITNTTGISATGKYDWLDTNSNLISGNEIGLAAGTVTSTILTQTGIERVWATGTIFSDYNLLFNTINYTNVITGVNDVVGVNPLITGTHGYLQLGSPAIDRGMLGEPTPAGGGARADIGWHELLAAPISVFMGQPDDSVAAENIGVGQVEYAVVPVVDPTSPITSTLPAVWTLASLADPAAKLTYWNATYTPTVTGYYRIYSRASDTLGNAEIDAEDWYEGAFYADDTAPIVTLSVTVLPIVDDQWAQLTAEVTDYVGTSFDVDDIYFEINGERAEGIWSIHEWEPDGVTPRKFHYIFMDRDQQFGGYHDYAIQAFAVDGAGQIGSSTVVTASVKYLPIQYYYDATAPRVDSVTFEDYTQPLPPYDDLMHSPILISGLGFDTISDDNLAWPNESRSRIDGWELSFDGGLSWEPAEPSSYTIQQGNLRFVYTYTVPLDLDATTIPIKVRVTDMIGFSSVKVVTMTVDTGAPRLVGEILMDADDAEGMHLDDTSTAALSWHLPSDGSSVVNMLYSVGSLSEEDPPSHDLSGTSIQVNINDPNFRIHIGAEDQVGNIDWRGFGPWYLGQLYGVPWDAGGAFQSIAGTMDGYLDIDHNEWLTATEWLDEDDRPGIAQSLYATWDSYQSYIGWQGAKWDSDGTIWVYWDLWNGGTSVPVTGTQTLPFDADYAVSVSDSSTAQGWAFDGVIWGPSLNPPYAAHSPETGGTEFQFMFGDFIVTDSFDHHRMFAYAVNDGGQVWSAFPVLNTLDGAFGYYYEWPVSTGTDLLKKPIAAREPHLFLNATSLPPTQDTLSHGSNFNYVLDIENKDPVPSQNVQVQLNGTAGMNYLGVTGASCASCAASDDWLLDVPAIPGGGSQRITVTAQLDSDLTGLIAVTTTVRLQTDLLLPLQEDLNHILDLDPPTVDVLQNPGNAIDTGPQAFFGTSDDGIGTGVELVELSLDGSIWQTAVGTLSWSAELDAGVASGTWDLYMRATDYHGLVSEIVTATFVIDELAPLITATVPSLAGNSVIALIDGTTSDPSPPGAEVQQVELQMDSAAAGWQSVSLYDADPAGVHDWIYTWSLPHEDGVTHTLRVRATDYGNNITTSNWYTTVVDTVPPAVTFTLQLTQTGVAHEPVLSGSVTDGLGVHSVTVLVYPTVGEIVYIDVTPAGEAWSYQPNLAPGVYRLFVQAEDTAGNQVLYGPFDLTVLDEYLLTVATDGTGSGGVVGPGIACPGDCIESFSPGSAITLTALADVSSTFIGWSGACMGAGDCAVTMTETKTVTATFTLDQYPLNVSLAGDGSGSVSSDPSGIDCGADCTETFNYGTVVTLTATADLDSTFLGWSGACTGIGDCVAAITATKRVTATFMFGTDLLTVSKTGEGSGSVTSDPAGIDCGGSCMALFDTGTVVTLTASADVGSIFAGWGGAGCSGTDDCVFMTSGTQAVTATFAIDQPLLTVSIEGGGSGEVNSLPVGIACTTAGGDCSELLPYGTIVTLTASADLGSTFAGWSGAGCSGSGDCVVALLSAETVTATFEANFKYYLPIILR